MPQEREKTQFPPNFAWGTSLSAYQTEGGNTNDWSEWERKHQQPDHYNGMACNFYHRYPEDFRLASEVLHTNAIRLSIEWSRVQPEKGTFDAKALDHYVRMLEEANKNGLSPMVTFHHFTNPIWYAEIGGWAKPENVSRFIDYVTKTSDRLHSLTSWYLTMNEPRVYADNAYFQGRWAPEKKNLVLALQVYRNLAAAHRSAYDVLKESDNSIPVSYADNMVYFRGLRPVNRLLQSVFNYAFLHMSRGSHDFIGINYYNPFYLTASRESKAVARSDYGWPIDPHGLYDVTMKTWKRYHLPIIITENGIADEKDEKRGKFIVDHLRELARSMRDGANVRGYFHWSLLDNFEWHDAYTRKFGLIAVDFRNSALPRTPRGSAVVYGEICRTGQLPRT